MGSNPLYPNNRDLQFGWADEVTDNFTLTGGDMPGSASDTVLLNIVLS